MSTTSGRRVAASAHRLRAASAPRHHLDVRAPVASSVRTRRGRRVAVGDEDPDRPPPTAVSPFPVTSVTTPSPSSHPAAGTPLQTVPRARLPVHASTAARPPATTSSATPGPRPPLWHGQLGSRHSRHAAPAPAAGHVGQGLRRISVCRDLHRRRVGSRPPLRPATLHRRLARGAQLGPPAAPLAASRPRSCSAGGRSRVMEAPAHVRERLAYPGARLHRRVGGRCRARGRARYLFERTATPPRHGAQSVVENFSRMRCRSSTVRDAARGKALQLASEQAAPHATPARCRTTVDRGPARARESIARRPLPPAARCAGSAAAGILSGRTGRPGRLAVVAASPSPAAPSTSTRTQCPERLRRGAATARQLLVQAHRTPRAARPGPTTTSYRSPAGPPPRRRTCAVSHDAAGEKLATAHTPARAP